MNSFYVEELNDKANVYKDARDLKIFCFCNFDEYFKVKDYIKVKKTNKKGKVVLKQKNGNEYNIYYYKNKNKILLAQCTYNENESILENIKIRVWNDDINKYEFTIDAYKLLSLQKYDNNKLECFKGYYGLQKNIENIYLKHDKNKYRKYLAMEFYLLVKRTLENNYVFKTKKLKVSEPNVFIRGHFVEYDLLILKDEVDINQGIYNSKDVLATVELKLGSIWLSIEKIERYINSEKYNIDKDIPHILIAGYMNFNRIEKMRYNKNNYFDIFVYETFNGTKNYFIDNVSLDSIIEKL